MFVCLLIALNVLRYRAVDRVIDVLCDIDSHKWQLGAQRLLKFGDDLFFTRGIVADANDCLVDQTGAPRSILHPSPMRRT